ncbi:hypothetical protein PPL_00098 [Heterostelium album PN500]|uniref:Uncharacterized protein n=1 Tax=Heterostelium pallidum (strain ATCC 26659 / Pp 5 / PN500) TaxID=670386 RepID=D3AVI5_HETP5|nr:hypothetical protein PPL_00098 [Heterostelium album PN500]EFA86308.1 hypothetical protein PPL_00098 [Heterostelium album PN500]|eukprot:XP_020438413.1 hypothetical protein PPL_00098 [Heterostelium album PN500]
MSCAPDYFDHALPDLIPSLEYAYNLFNKFSFKRKTLQCSSATLGSSNSVKFEKSVANNNNQNSTDIVQF